MNTKSRDMRYIMAVVLVLCFNSMALAQSQGRELGKRGVARQENFDAIFKELNLSPQQEQKISDQRNQEKEQSQALRQKMAEVRSQLKQELDQPVPDKVKVYSLIADMKELIGKRMEQRVERIFSLKEILTPKQFKLLNQKMGQFNFKKEGGREKISRNDTHHGKFGYRGKCARICQRLG
jgi:Spy/CpxP family protein refolding chaperone